MTSRPGKPDAPALPVDRRLLDAALVELRDAGVAGVSLRSIARRAGISHQAVRHHFRDRAALFSALATEGLAELGDQMEAAAEAASDPAQGVAAMGGAYISFARQQPAMFALLFGSPLVDASDAGLLEGRLRVLHGFTARVQAAVDTGWGHPLDAETLATAAWSLAHGVAQLQESGLIFFPPGTDGGILLNQLLTAIATSTG